MVNWLSQIVDETFEMSNSKEKVVLLKKNAISFRVFKEQKFIRVYIGSIKLDLPECTEDAMRLVSASNTNFSPEFLNVLSSLLSRKIKRIHLEKKSNKAA